MIEIMRMMYQCILCETEKRYKNHFLYKFWLTNPWVSDEVFICNKNCVNNYNKIRGKNNEYTIINLLCRMQYIYYKNVIPYDDNNINIFIDNFIQKYLISKGTKLIRVTFTEEEIVICKEFIDDYLRDYLQNDTSVKVS